MNKLSDYIGQGYAVNLHSSVFIELMSENPVITIWSNDKKVNVTSKSEYCSYAYYYKNNKINLYHIYDIDDIDKISKIYSICASSYTTNDDYKISSMVDILENKKLERK